MPNIKVNWRIYKYVHASQLERFEIVVKKSIMPARVDSNKERVEVAKIVF